jgi:hypothetical protein
MACSTGNVAGEICEPCGSPPALAVLPRPGRRYGFELGNAHAVVDVQHALQRDRLTRREAGRKIYHRLTRPRIWRQRDRLAQLSVCGCA